MRQQHAVAPSTRTTALRTTATRKTKLTGRQVRKIRCDGRPEGCTPCEQNRTPCRTTDRITGRATVRGHAEAMESENSYLRAQIADLQAQLKEHSIEPRAPPAYNALQPPSHPWSSVPSESQPWTEGPRQTSSSPLPGYVPAGAAARSETLPHFKQGSLGDNYLGVAAGDSLLSHIKGTSLSIFGTEIDITDFMAGEAEYEASPMSYTTLVNIANAGQHVDKMELPPYSELQEYAIWYLRSLNPYTMLVHKPAFMELVRRTPASTSASTYMTDLPRFGDSATTPPSHPLRPKS